MTETFIAFARRSSVEVGQCHECAEPLLDLVARQTPQAIRAEVLDAERREHAAVDDRSAQRFLVEAAALGEASEHATREAVAGTGRIDDVLQRIRGNRKDVVPGK